MHLLRNIPLRAKQRLIIMLTSTIALLLACAAFVSYDVGSFRKELTARISGIAEVMAYNCAAAVDFNDAQTAEQTLAALRAQPEVIAACVYDRQGRTFAVYQRTASAAFHPPEARPAGHEFVGGQLRLFRPIRQNNETIGTIFIASNLTELSRRLERYAGIVALVFLASLAVTFLLSQRLQRIVSDPIVRLAQVTRSVALEKNYSVRAEKHGEDEIGQLIDGFNDMLAQIQHRDSALQAARDHLEHRVDERTRELAGSISLLNATLNSTADGIMAVNLAGRMVCYNEKFAAMWNIPADMLAQGDNDAVLAHSAAQVKAPEKFLQRVKEVRANPEAEAFDLIAFSDGRAFERIIRPQRLGEACVGCVLSFRDVTERKKAEDRLQEKQQELVVASRQAGMAEVATNVLHNVGNVLNSVNTSASIVMDSVRNSKVVGVSRMASLFDENRADLVGFLGRDNRAEQVHSYLKSLGVHLTEEHKTILGELNELRKNVEHIKEIVAMQQSYAKISGLEELHSPAGLMEDALRIHLTALKRQNVRIDRDVDEVADILVDKHKVLQILVNLIGNAKYALGDAQLAQPVLTLSVKASGDGRVRLSVRDNGIGISAENLIKIFSHGFTTRKNGHGFGLHSGFLAAKEMGGKLTVQSEGVGKGAAFILELPEKRK
jgi:PAS domain S-box-containing protein